MTSLWKAPTLVPTLAVDDVAAAVAWLTEVFGFRERADARLSWPGGGAAWIEQDDTLINLVSDGAHGLASPRGGSASVGLKVYVEDVDAHYARARAGGARILSPPQDGFWGGRIYRAADLDGHHWEFSQRGRDLDARLWSLPPGVTIGPPPE
jgi:uncharacterized glyoxalase superfamily protein PhnB